MKRRFLVWLIFFSVLFAVCSCSSDEADAEAHLQTAREHAENSHYHDALREFDKTIRIVNGNGNKRHDLLMKSYNGMGSISYIFGDTLTSIIWYKRAWLETKKAGDNDYTARICSNLSIAYNAIGETDSARIYNEQLRRLLGRETSVPFYQYYFNLGRIEYRAGNDIAAVAALDSAINYYQKSGGRHENSEIFILKAKTFLRLKERAKAAEFAKLGDINVEFETNDNNRLRAYRDLAFIFGQLGDTIKAEAFTDHAESLKKAIIEGNQSLKIEQSDPNHFPLRIVFAVCAIIVASLALLFFYLLRRRARQSAFTDEEPTDDNAPCSDSGILVRIDESLRRTKAFCQSDFDISALSRLINVNQKYISRTINASGVNFRTFIARYRVDEAIDMMKDPETLHNFTIESVGKKVGFKSHSNFIAAFKKIKGETPSAYFRKHSK